MEFNKIDYFDLSVSELNQIYQTHEESAKIFLMISALMGKRLLMMHLRQLIIYHYRFQKTSEGYLQYMEYVEVFLDNQYIGLYSLIEPIDYKQLNLDLTKGEYEN